MKSEEVTRILENAIRIGKGVIRYGSVASYIPELAKADKNKLGICLYTIDGNQFETGNTEDRFTIQSISKVMALCLALETFGAEFVFDHVGVEPSGEAFNSLVELDNRSNRPFNPMIKFRSNYGCKSASEPIFHRRYAEVYAGSMRRSGDRDRRSRISV